MRNDFSAIGEYQYINVLNYNTLGYQTTFTYNFYPYLDVALGFGHTGTYFSFDSKGKGLSDYRFSGELNANIGWYIPLLKIKLSGFYKYTGRSWMFGIDENNNVEVGKISKYQNLDFTLLKKFFADRLFVSTGVKMYSIIPISILQEIYQPVLIQLMEEKVLLVMGDSCS